MSTRRLALTIWAVAILATGVWWPLSYRYGSGFTASLPVIPETSGGSRNAPFDLGFAVTSGMGKIILYASWGSVFTRKGAFCEPVLAHEFPHPWLGFQNEGGRLWVSFPIGPVFTLIVIAAAYHLRTARSAKG